MIVHSGYDERYFAHFVHSSKNRVRDQFPKSFTVKRIGGRGGTRTPGPLLAKQGGENTKRLCWCRLHGKSTKFSLFNCPEVVPNIPVFRSSALLRSPGSITHMPVLQFPGHFRVANRELRAGRFAALTLPSLSGRRPVRHALPRNRLRRAA